MAAPAERAQRPFKERAAVVQREFNTPIDAHADRGDEQREDLGLVHLVLANSSVRGVADLRVLNCLGKLIRVQRLVRCLPACLQAFRLARRKNRANRIQCVRQDGHRLSQSRGWRGGGVRDTTSHRWTTCFVTPLPMLQVQRSPVASRLQSSFDNVR